MITLLIGGVRAGKSARALTIAESRRDDRPLLFVATAQAFDDEMRARIDAHRRERGPRWSTLESPLELAADLEAYLGASEPSAVVIDCITLWVSNILLALPDDADAERIVADRARALGALLAKLSANGTDIVLVTNEVGLGIVPSTPLGRRYRDALGRANQLLAAASDVVTLMVAGLSLPLKQ